MPWNFTSSPRSSGEETPTSNSNSPRLRLIKAFSSFSIFSSTQEAKKQPPGKAQRSKSVEGTIRLHRTPDKQRSRRFSDAGSVEERIDAIKQNIKELDKDVRSESFQIKHPRVHSHLLQQRESWEARLEEVIAGGDEDSTFEPPTTPIYCITPGDIAKGFSPGPGR